MNFINSHKLSFGWCMDIVRRKLILVTLETFKGLKLSPFILIFAMDVASHADVLRATIIEPLKVIHYFFLVGYALSKIQPLTSWQLTNRTVNDISHRSRHSIYQSPFSPREFIIWFKFIPAKKVDLETSSLARSLCDLMHWSSLPSLLRTYERSTWRKSKPQP